MDLARFTQIRPVQSGNSFELAKRHFRLEIPKEREGFLQHLERATFAQLGMLALEHLQDGKVIERANLCLNRLSEGSQADGLGEEVGIELPPADVLQYAYRIAFAFPELTNSKGTMLPEYEGSEIDHPRSLEARFPVRLTYDLIALYLTPGVLAEYRAWLSILFRLCAIFESGYTIENVVKALIEMKGVTNLGLAEPGQPEFAARRFFYGRVLMPREFKADLPPVMAPVLPDQADGLHSGNPTGQVRDHIDGVAGEARDYTLPKVPHMGIALTRPGREFPPIPKNKPVKPRVIIGDINGVSTTRRGDR